MSFLPIKQENEDAPTGQTTNAPGTEAPPQTGGSVGEESGGAPAKGSITGTPTQFGSSASKLGDYLSANSPQIQGQADTLSGTLNTQYGNLQSGITNAANQFGSQVQGGYAAPNQDVVGQAMANPAGFASDPNNVKAFQGQYNNAYTGPTNFEGTGGYADIQNQVGQAVKQSNLLGSQGGLQSYLQGKGNNPTQAMSTLDSLLLRGNPEAQQKINTAAGQFGNLTGQLGTATAGANQSVLDAQKAAQDSQTYARSQFDPYAQGFGKSLTDNLSGINSSRDAYNTQLNSKQGTLRDLQNYFNSYGATSGVETPNMLGESLGYSPITNPASLENTATSDQFSKDAALSQLLGSSYSPVLNQSLASQAGTFGAVPDINQQNIYSPESVARQMASEATRKQFQAIIDQSGGGRYPTDTSPVGTQTLPPEMSRLMAESGRGDTNEYGQQRPTNAYHSLLQQLSGYAPGFMSIGPNGRYVLNSNTPPLPPTGPDTPRTTGDPNLRPFQI